MSSRRVMNYVRALFSLIAIGVLFLPQWIPSAGARVEAVVSGTGGLGLWLKAGPDYDTNRVTGLPEGQLVQVLEGPLPGGNGRDWARIRAGADTGWVVSDFLTVTNWNAADTTSKAPPAPSTPAGVAPGGWGKVTGTYPTTGLRLRSEAAPWNTLLKVLPEDTVIQVISGPVTGGNGNPWYQVETTGSTGWVDGTYLIGASAPAAPASPPPAPPAPAPRRADGFVSGAWVQVSNTYPASGLRLRAAAAPTETLLAVLPEGTKLTVLDGPNIGGNGDPWYRVITDDLTGWVSGLYLVATTPPAQTAPLPDPANAPGAAMVALALKQLGKPYYWGGNGPEGFDCSGLVVYVAQQILGVNLPRTSQEQAFAGYHVDRTDLLPGDLVFFADTYEPGVTHVGIYVGNNHWISGQDQYTGVIVASLDDPYWKSHYFGARRIT